jgi:hypothetical protein
MLWLLAAGLAVAGSVACFVVAFRNPSPLQPWAYPYFLLPVFLAMIPYYRRTQKAMAVTAILLGLYSVSPLSFGTGMFFYPAALLMLIAAMAQKQVERKDG